MRRFALLAAVVASAACAAGPPPTTVATHGHVEAAAVASDSAGAPPSTAEAAVTELTIMRPEKVACALRSSEWSGPLQLRDGGPTFATVRSTSSTLHIASGGGPAIVDVTGVFDLTAVVSSPRVFLARPMALGDFAVPFATMPLILATPHAEGSLTVGLDISDRFEAPQAVTQVVRCRDLTPTATTYDAYQFVRMPESIDVAIEARTELRSQPRGRALARVRDSAGIVRFGTLSDGARRVVLEGNGYLAVGWVPAERVYVPNAGYGRGIGTLGTVGYGTSRSSTCKTAVPIWGQLGDERAVIGRTKPGARFTRAFTDKQRVPKGFIAISAASGWIDLAPGALLLLREADLARCAPIR